MTDLTPSPGRALRAAAIASAVAGLCCTWRIRRVGADAVDAALEHGPVIYAFWHGEQLPLAAAHAHQGVVGMASRSADGALLADVISRLGYGVVRGSTSRGGPMALRGCLRALAAGSSVALAVDGPRGPRHSVAPGAAALSRISGRPIVCTSSRSTLAVSMNSWDAFVVPLPLCRIVIRYELVWPESLDVGALQESVRRSLVGVTGSNEP